MTDTHFEISKKLVNKAVGFLVMCLIGVCVWIFNDSKAESKAADIALTESMKTNQVAIQLSNDRIQQSITDVKVLDERVDGHEANGQAHHN